MWSGIGGTTADQVGHACSTSRKRQLLEQRITTATSVSTFEESDIHSYRAKLRLAFRELVQCSIECFGASTTIECSGSGSSRKAKGRSRHIFDIDKFELNRRTNSVATHYDNDAIVTCLGQLQSNFSSLFQHHDEFIHRSVSDNFKRTESTALEEVLYAILDPTIVPYACSGPFIQLLTQAYVEDSNSRPLSTIGNQAHGALLKRALCAFVHRSPQIDLANLLTSYFRNTLRIGIMPKKNLQKTEILDAIDNYNVNRASQCVELMGYIVKTLPDTRFEGSAVSILVECTRDLDGADILLARLSSNRSTQGVNISRRTSSSCCSRCQMTKGKDDLRRIKVSLMTTTNRKRSANTASLMDLHDKAFSGNADNDAEEDSGIAIESYRSNVDEGGPTVQRISLTKQMRHYGNEPKVSMKKIMGSASSSSGDSIMFANEAGCACLCYTESSTNTDSTNREAQGVGRRCSMLPLKMIQLRSDAYRALVSLAKFHLYENIPRNESINAVIFNKAIQQMRKHPMCAASRLSAVLLADVRGIESGFLPLLDKLLASSTCSLIRIYSEIVVNLAIFDDPVVFWKATKPLFDRALNMSSYCQEYQRTVRRAMSYIMVERYRTVSAIDRFELQPYINGISEMFGSQGHWTHEPMLQEEKDEIIHTLQTLGILGFLNGDEEMITAEMCDSFPASLCSESFPFLPESSLRDAVARMGPHVGCNRFLSRLDARISIDTLRNDEEQAQIKPKDRADSLDENTPILEHLNDDFLIRRIFSFLNHRKLAALSSVCRVWRQIANESALWQRLYRLRFKTLVEIDALPESASPKVKSVYSSKENERDWRKLFNAKWLAERQLRSTFSRDGKWKHRTCEFVGCLAVLKSKATFEKHICKHMKDLAKKVERADASKDRKRKRLAASKKEKEAEKEKKQAKKCGQEKGE